jgi:hypothetical protein
LLLACQMVCKKHNPLIINKQRIHG